MEQKRGFASRIGFIFSMAAFCIGIGNLWKFPYMVGNNGGGAFLLLYLAAVLLVGIPAFVIELTMGRKSRLSPIAGMRTLAGKEKTPWSVIGVLGCIAIFIMVSYAAMIVGGWTIGYIVKLISGSLSGLTPDELGAAFGSFTSQPINVVYSAIQVFLVWMCLCGGVKKGVEKVNSILMPVLLAIMIGLAAYSVCLPGAMEGLKWYLIPDFSKISMASVSAACVQVFYSIGVGMCCAYVYGSYFAPKGKLVGSAVTTAVMDTSVAVLAGLICVPALFVFGIEPTAGPSLIFVTLPNLFNSMGSFGLIFGLLFMICVFFAGFSSNIGGSEALVAVLCDAKPNWSRRKVSTIVCVAQFLFSILFILSFGGSAMLSNLKILNLGFFDFFDFVSSLCLSLGTILMLAFLLFRWKFSGFMEAANEGSEGSKVKVYKWMKGYICYIYPIVLVVVFFFIMDVYF